MCATLPQSLSHSIQHLERDTQAWFYKQDASQAEELFIQYYYESRKGELKHLYAGVLKQAIEEKISVQSVITDCLTAVVAAVLYLPQRAVRLTLGILTYWLTQYHSGQHSELPSRREARELIAGIINDEIIKVG